MLYGIAMITGWHQVGELAGAAARQRNSVIYSHAALYRNIKRCLTVATLPPVVLKFLLKLFECESSLTIRLISSRSLVVSILLFVASSAIFETRAETKSRSLSCNVASETSATTSSPSVQGNTLDKPFGATGTTAKPPRLVSSFKIDRSNFRQHCPSVELLASNVINRSLAQKFAPFATTTLKVTALQSAGSKFYCFSANTLALPYDATTFALGGWLDSDQVTECFTSQVFDERATSETAATLNRSTDKVLTKHGNFLTTHATAEPQRKDRLVLTVAPLTVSSNHSDISKLSSDETLVYSTVWHGGARLNRADATLRLAGALPALSQAASSIAGEAA